MRKLIRGILDYRRRIRPRYRKRFARLALGQKPDALLIACSDSRVAPNLFASTEPGELLVVRNVGNLVPPFRSRGERPDQAEGAALEFASLVLAVSDVVVCGHSSCGAMQALLERRKTARLRCLTGWLENARPAAERFRRGARMDGELSDADHLSQLNVLEQVEHVRSHPWISEGVQTGRLRLHAWWFDIGSAEIRHFRSDLRRFVAIDEREAKRLLSGPGDLGPRGSLIAAIGAPARER